MKRKHNPSKIDDAMHAMGWHKVKHGRRWAYLSSDRSHRVIPSEDPKSRRLRWVVQDRSEGRWNTTGTWRWDDPVAAAWEVERTRVQSNPDQGHHYRIGDAHYADTAFLNALNRLPSQQWSVRHRGFGEFVIDGPAGSVEVDRMRGVDFPGQSGRSHKLYDSKGGTTLTRQLIEEVEGAGLSEDMTDSALAIANPVHSERTRRLALRMANPF